jgi:Tfp pilus assembly protein PilO
MVSKNGNLSPMLWTLIAGVVAVAYVFLSFLPTQRKIGSLRSQRTQDERKIVEAEMLAREIRVCRDQLTEAQAIVDAWRRRSTTLRGPMLFDAVTDAATANQLEITEMTPGAKRAMQSLRIVPIQFKGMGSVEAIHGFLHDLEGLPLLVWCNELAVVGASNNPNHPESLELRFELLVFEGKAKFSDQAEIAASR